MKKNTPTVKQNSLRISCALRRHQAEATAAYKGARMTPAEQKKIANRMIKNNLTKLQRQTLESVMSGKKLVDIAKERGVTRSSVTRVLNRTFERLRRTGDK